MDFGIFTEQIRRGSSQGDWFRELLELADAGEEWGLDVVWMAEMLVNPDRSVLSAPLPPTMPATCVPCPLQSRPFRPRMSYTLSARPPNSGWSVQIPVSMMYACTPAPVAV